LKEESLALVSNRRQAPLTFSSAETFAIPATTTSERNARRWSHEARDEKRLQRLQRQLASLKLLIVDELCYVPLSPIGAELLFEACTTQRGECMAMMLSAAQLL
jgi:hypothetical protein